MCVFGWVGLLGREEGYLMNAVIVEVVEMEMEIGRGTKAETERTGQVTHEENKVSGRITLS